MGTILSSNLWLLRWEVCSCGVRGYFSCEGEGEWSSQRQLLIGVFFCKGLSLWQPRCICNPRNWFMRIFLTSPKIICQFARLSPIFGDTSAPSPSKKNSGPINQIPYICDTARSHILLDVVNIKLPRNLDEILNVAYLPRTTTQTRKHEPVPLGLPMAQQLVKSITGWPEGISQAALA